MPLKIFKTKERANDYVSFRDIRGDLRVVRKSASYVQEYKELFKKEC